MCVFPEPFCCYITSLKKEKYPEIRQRLKRTSMARRLFTPLVVIRSFQRLNKVRKASVRPTVFPKWKFESLRDGALKSGAIKLAAVSRALMSIERGEEKSGGREDENLLIWKGFLGTILIQTIERIFKVADTRITKRLNKHQNISVLVTNY